MEFVLTLHLHFGEYWGESNRTSLAENYGVKRVRIFNAAGQKIFFSESSYSSLNDTQGDELLKFFEKSNYLNYKMHGNSLEVSSVTRFHELFANTQKCSKSLTTAHIA